MSTNPYLTDEPTELAFGTSGLRGLVADMTDMECYINARGFLEYLQSIGELTGKVYIAGDLRASTPAIMLAMEKAITDSAQTVEHCGFIPTPALAFYAQQKTSPCIMVTGSHIPDDRNGIKFYKASGEVLKSDEQAIKKYVLQVREDVYENVADIFNDDGSFEKPVSVTTSTKDAENTYIDRYVSVFSGDLLEGKKVVVYQHSAVGRDINTLVLQKLGAEVVNVGRSEKFIPIDTENVTAADREYFKKIASENPGLFAIVSTDGDGDRPFLIDENGVFHRGDDLGAVVAASMNADFAAYPISSSDGTDQYMNSKKIDF
ncbi:MAG: phosphomannomutase, partial [Candidatus Saccharimonadales bacterium]